MLKIKERERGGGGAKFEKIVSALESNSVALLDIIESILFLSELDSEILSKSYKNQDVLSILENVLAILSIQAQDKKINLNLKVNSDEHFLAPGNKTQIFQVFVNLISNAMKFSEPESEIEISLKRIIRPDLEVQIEFAVMDHGLGIPTADLDKLFSRFFRAKNVADGTIPGSGLGLAIVQKTMELHHGEVKVESQEGEGSTFTLIFPGTKSVVEKMVQTRRLEVLGKAINALENSTLENLAAVCHDRGGAIAFYTFEDEGAELETFSVELQSGNKIDDNEIEKKRKYLINRLQLRQSEITKPEAVENG